MEFSQCNAQFFTATILTWKNLLQENKYKDVVVESLRFFVKEKGNCLCLCNNEYSYPFGLEKYKQDMRNKMCKGFL